MTASTPIDRVWSPLAAGHRAFGRKGSGSHSLDSHWRTRRISLTLPERGVRPLPSSPHGGHTSQQVAALTASSGPTLWRPVKRRRPPRAVLGHLMRDRHVEDAQGVDVESFHLVCQSAEQAGKICAVRTRVRQRKVATGPVITHSISMPHRDQSEIRTSPTYDDESTRPGHRPARASPSSGGILLTWDPESSVADPRPPSD